MAYSKEYTDEQLNYYRICYLTTDILAEGLREIFKQEWDKLYKSTKGEWKDEPRNGIDFYNGESLRNQKRNAHILATMKNGNRGEWDCTMLFYAILFSDCVGPGISAIVRKNVDHLRNFRNQEFAQTRQGSLSEIDFQNAVSKVEVAFQGLSLPTVKIQDLKYQKTFQTKDLTKVRKEVDDLNQEVQQLRKLIEFNDNLVAERFFDDRKEMPGGSSFPHENMGCFNSPLCTLRIAYLPRSPSFSHFKYFYLLYTFWYPISSFKIRITPGFFFQHNSECKFRIISTF